MKKLLRITAALLVATPEGTLGTGRGSATKRQSHERLGFGALARSTQARGL